LTTVLFPTTWLTANPIENLKSPLQKYCIIIIISSKIWSSLVYCHAMLLEFRSFNPLSGGIAVDNFVDIQPHPFTGSQQQ